VTLSYQDQHVSARSLLEILMLAASRAKVKVEAEGEDAEAAIKSILQLARNKFNIKY
jgi:phosphocarrier protein